MAGQQKDFLVNVELQIQDKASLALNEFRTLIVSLEPATKLFSDALGKVGSAISELSAKSSGINTKLEKLGTSAEKSSPQVDKLTQSISKLNAEYVLLKETSNVKLAPLTSAKAVGEDGAEVAGFQKSIQAANRSLNALVKNAGLLGDSIPGLEAFQKTVSSVNKSVSSLIKNVTVLSSVAPGLEGLPASLEGASKYSMLLGETAPSLGAFQKEISAASSSARVFGTNLARVGEVLITAIPRIELAAIPINATAVAMEKAATAASFYQTEIRNLAKAYLELKAVSSVKLEPLTSRTPKTQESAVSETYANSVASASRSTSGLAQSLGNVDRRLRSINDLLSSTATKASETTESFLKLTAQINALSTAFSNAAGHAVVMNTAINQAALKTIEFSKAKKDIDALTGSVNAVAGGVRQVTSAPFSNLTSSVGGSKLALEDTSKVLDVLSHKSAFVSKILYGISENFLGVGRDSKTGLGVALSKFEELEVKLSKFNSGSITMGIGLLALGAGLVVPFAEAVKVTASLEQEMSKIQAVTAATAPTMEAIKHQALQLGKETTFSAQQAAEGFRTLALSGLSVKDTMVALPTVLNVAAAGFMTIAKAASIVTSVMQSYGMQADEIAKASDVLTKAANESNSTLEDLGVSFHYVGAVAKTAGLAFDSTVGALALLHNAGLKGCYDDQTEILTKTGFKFFKDLKKGEEIFTMNPTSKKLEWQEPTEYFEYAVDEPLFKMKTLYIDLAVTDNHNLFVESRNGDPRFVQAKAFREGTFYRTGLWEGVNQEFFVLPSILSNGGFRGSEIKDSKLVPMESWVKFLGWYFSEGSLNKKHSSGNYTVVISQKKKENWKEIEDVLNTLGFHFSFNEKSCNFNMCNQQLWTELFKYGVGFKDKRVPDYVKNLSADLLKVFYEAFRKGDGDCQGNLYSSGPGLIDDLQEICIKAGFGVQKKKVAEQGAYRQIKGEFYEVKNDAFVLNVSKKCVNPFHSVSEESRTGRDRIYWEHYKGKVYCVEVPNHVMLVRRNGKVVFCGNSMAGTSLRGVLESLLNPTHAQAKVMEDLSKRIGGLGIQLHDASGRFVKFSQLIKQFEQAGVTTSEVFALFGQRAGPGFASLLQQGSSAVEEMEFRLINSNNAAKEMAEIMRKNLLGSWENLKSAAEALGDTIGTQLVPFFTALFTTTTSVLNAITTLADKFPVLTQALAFLAGGFGLLITALGATMFAWFMLGIGAEKGWVVMKEFGSVIVKLSGALADHVFGLGLTSKAEIIAASAIQATTAAMSEEALAAATMRDISITNAAAQLAQAEATSKAAISATALADARLVAARAEASAAAATVASLEAQLAASANQNANAALLQSLSAARIDLATKEAAVTQAVTEATLANTVATNAAIEAKAAAASLQGLEALKTEAAAINAATNATIDYSTAQNAELAIQRTLAVELEKTAAQRIVAARATAASMDSLEILAGQQVREAEVRLLAAKQVENQATAQYLLTGRISDYIEVVRAEDAVNIQKTALLQAQQAQYAALSASMTAQGELTLAENALKDLQALNSLNIATATYNASLTAEQILKEESIALALANATVVEAETAALVSKTIAEKEAAASKFALTSAALEVANAELRAADAAFVLNASKENEAALSAASAKAKQLEIAAYEELIALERLEAASLKARNEALIAQTALSDLQGLAAHEEALKAEAIARIQNSTGISAETAALAERDRQMLLSAEVSEKAALDNLAHAATVSEAAKRKSDLAKASLVAAEAEAAYETQLVSSTGATENYNRVIASRVAADNAAAAASAATAEQLAAADLLEVNRLRHAEAARNLNILSTEIATKSAAARLVEAQVSAKADQEAVAALLAKKGATDAEVISKAVSRAETSAAIVVQRAHTLQIIEERAMLEGLTGVQYKETLARLVKIRAIQAETAYMATLNGLQVATITLTEALSGALAKGTAWFLAIDKAVLTYTANLFGLNAALSASSAYSLAAGNSATFMGKTMAFLKAGFFSAIATGFTLIASAVELFGKSLKFLLVASPWIALIAGAVWLLIEAYKRWWVTTDDKIKQNEEEKKSLEEKNKALLDTSKNTEEYIAELSKLLPMSDEWIAVNEKLAKLLPQLKSEFVVDSKGNLRQVVADIKEAEEASKQFKKDVNEVNFSKAQQDVKTLNLLLEEQQKNEVSLELARKRYNDAVASAKSYGISEFRSEAAVQYKVALDAINQTIATTSSKINFAKEASIDLMKAHINAGGTIDQFMQKLGISATNASDAAKEMRKTYEATANSMKSLTFGGQVGQASIQIMRGLELEKSDTVSALKEVTDKMKTVESTASTIYKNMLGLWKNNLDGMKLANQAAWDVMELRAKENQSTMVKLELDKLKMYNSTSVKWQTDLKAFYDAEIAKAKAKGLSAALLEKDFTTLRLGELKAREEHNKKSLETLLKQETELSKDILSLKRDLVGGLYELELQRLEFEGKEVNLMEQGALKKKAIEEEFVEFQKAIRNKDYEGAKAFYSEMLKLGTSLKKDFTLGSDTKESFSAMFKTAGESLRGLNIETTKSKEAAVGLINSFRASGGFNGLDDIAKKIKEIYENESKIDSSGLKKALQVDSTKLEETNSTLQKLQTHVDTLENRKVSINMKQESLKDLTDISDLLVRISQAQDSFSSSTKLSQSSKDVSEIKQSWENTRAVLESVAKTLNSNTNLSKEFGTVFLDSSSNAEEESKRLLRVFESLSGKMKTFRDDEAVKIAPKVKAGDFIAENQKDFDDIRNYMHSQFKVTIKPEFDLASHTASVQNLVKSINKALEDPGAISTQFISEKLQKDLVESFKGKTVPVGVTIEPGDTFFTLENKILELLAGVKNKVSDINNTPVSIEVQNQELTATQTLLKEILDLKQQINSTSISPSVKGPELQLPGVNTGGLIQRFAGGGKALFQRLNSALVPGVGDKDTVPAVLTPGEFVIRKGAVAKYGEKLFHALNSGMLTLANTGGLISQSMFPSVQHFSNGGSVLNSGSGDVVNVNLLIGSKSFPVKTQAGIAKDLVNELQNAARGLSR